MLCSHGADHLSGEGPPCRAEPHARARRLSWTSSLRFDEALNVVITVSSEFGALPADSPHASLRVVHLSGYRVHVSVAKITISVLQPAPKESTWCCVSSAQVLPKDVDAAVASVYTKCTI